MDLRLTDKVVVVTGAASGIGQATARLLTEEGAVVVGVDRDPVDTGLGARGHHRPRRPHRPRRARPGDRHRARTARPHRRPGQQRRGLQARSSFLAITDEQWLATFDLNFHAARRMSRAAVPAMLGANAGAGGGGGGGRLVHVGSDSARLPETGNMDYAAAKLSVLALSTSLATEFSPQGIRSNVVIPGPTRTPLYDRPGGFGDQAAELWSTDRESAITRMVTDIRPLRTGRIGQPDDVAQVVAYLVSPLSRPVTAAEWDVDGGALRQI
ncbi:SDR family oxidoreductase [Streptomyces sp. NPDC002769]|uniref:SDR family NAD(P)-dependent oxidoreductase n=1 Tax=Streptomyces sp. NPDC002769 TaxID=3154542 RepID=UPI00331FA150